MAKTVTFDVIARSQATGFDETNRKLDQQQKQLKLLSTAAVALGPALAPIGAAAVAAGASLGALGATGLLAFQGIKKEMADGTSTGKAYTAGVNTLKGNLDTLERTAARGVLTGFQNSVSAIQPLMPTLNADTAQLSSKLGDIASHVMPGLVKLFTTANPLLLDFANDLDKGAAKFEAWTQSSDGAQKFVDYARAELPKVEETLLSLATTAGHLAQGIAPLGGGSLTAITLFSKAINTIPVGVLQALAPAILALKVANTVSAGLGNLTNSLTDFAGGAGTASRAATALGEALPLISAATPAVILGIETISNQWSKIGPIVRGATLDATDNSKANLALAQSFWAVNPGAQATNAALLKYGLSAQGAKDITQNYGVTTQQLNAVLTQMGATQGQLASSMLSSTTYTTGLTAAQAGLASQVTSSATQIGYLNSELDKLSNFALDAEQQELKLRDSFAQATQTLKGNGSAINDNTAKGRANKEWLLSQIQAINSHVSAVGKQTGSVQKATAALQSDENGLRRAAAAAGLNKSQVDALIRSYAATPKQVSTAVKADTSQALGKIQGVQAALNNLQSYKVLQIVEVTSKITAGSAGTNLAARASGGAVQRGHKYLVNELGQELFVDTKGAYLLRGGPHMWTAPANGQIINAATVKGLQTKAGAVAGASLTQLPGAASSAISAVAKVLPYGSPITRQLQAEDKDLQKLVAHRAAHANQLKAANTKLAATIQQSNQEFNTVKGGVLGSFNITSAGRDVFGNVSAGGLISDLRTKVSQAGLFASDIKALSGKLDKGLLQQLAEAGPDASLSTLQALIGASPSQLKQINTLEGRLGAAGGVAGTATATALYGAQIKSQQALVKSIQAQQKSTDRLEKALQAIIARSLKVTIQGGDAKSIVRELERWVAAGGKLAIGKGVH